MKRVYIQETDLNSTSKPCAYELKQEDSFSSDKQSVNMANYTMGNGLNVYPVYISQKQEDGGIIQERRCVMACLRSLGTFAGP